MVVIMILSGGWLDIALRCLVTSAMQSPASVGDNAISVGRRQRDSDTSHSRMIITAPVAYAPPQGKCKTGRATASSSCGGKGCSSCLNNRTSKQRDNNTIPSSHTRASIASYPHRRSYNFFTTLLIRHQPCCSRGSPNTSLQSSVQDAKRSS